MSVSEKVKEYLDKSVTVSKNAIDKSLEVSKKALDKAGAVVQDFSDKSVVRIEIHQFEGKRDEQFRIMGKKAAEKFIKDGQETISEGDADIQPIITEIKRINKEIEKREVILSANE
jgi:hypothetical protein